MFSHAGGKNFYPIKSEGGGYFKGHKNDPLIFMFSRKFVQTSKRVVRKERESDAAEGGKATSVYIYLVYREGEEKEHRNV